MQEDLRGKMEELLKKGEEEFIQQGTVIATSYYYYIYYCAEIRKIIMHRCNLKKKKENCGYKTHWVCVCVPKVA